MIENFFVRLVIVIPVLAAMIPLSIQLYKIVTCQIGEEVDDK
jgi:hypothetical protein